MNKYKTSSLIKIFSAIAICIALVFTIFVGTLQSTKVNAAVVVNGSTSSVKFPSRFNLDLGVISSYSSSTLLCDFSVNLSASCSSALNSSNIAYTSLLNFSTTLYPLTGNYIQDIVSSEYVYVNTTSSNDFCNEITGFSDSVNRSISLPGTGTNFLVNSIYDLSTWYFNDDTQGSTPFACVPLYLAFTDWNTSDVGTDSNTIRYGLDFSSYDHYYCPYYVSNPTSFGYTHFNRLQSFGTSFTSIFTNGILGYSVDSLSVYRFIGKNNELDMWLFSPYSSYSPYNSSVETLYFNIDNTIDDNYNSGYTDGASSSSSTSYSQGYDNGYSAGQSSGQTDGYNNGYRDGQSDGYSTGYCTGQTNGYANGYASGRTDGISSANEYTFTGLFGAIIDVPVRTITSLLNFNILGVNLSAFFFGLLTLVIILAIVKLFRKG